MDTDPPSNATAPDDANGPILASSAASPSVSSPVVAAETSLDRQQANQPNVTSLPDVEQPSFVFSHTVSSLPPSSNVPSAAVPAPQPSSGLMSNGPMQADQVTRSSAVPSGSASVVAGPEKDAPVLTVVPALPASPQSTNTHAMPLNQPNPEGDSQYSLNQAEDPPQEHAQSSSPASVPSVSQPVATPFASISAFDTSLVPANPPLTPSTLILAAPSASIAPSSLKLPSSNTRNTITLTQTLTSSSAHFVRPSGGLSPEKGNSTKNGHSDNADQAGDGMGGGHLVDNTTLSRSSATSSSGYLGLKGPFKSSTPAKDLLLDTVSTSRASTSSPRISSHKSLTSSALDESALQASSDVATSQNQSNVASAAPTPTPNPVASAVPGTSVELGTSGNVNLTTYVTAGKTLFGQAAISAMAAGGAGGSVGVKTEEGGSKLSSFAIVGIVGGILVFFIAIYIAWYQWRSKRRGKALDKSAKGDEKRGSGDGDYDDDQTEASFGHDPFHDRATVYDRATWYEEDDRRSRFRETRYTAHTDDGNNFRRHKDERGRRDEGYDDGLEEYLDDDEEEEHTRGQHRTSEYGLSTYEGGLTAAVLDRTALPQTRRYDGGAYINNDDYDVDHDGEINTPHTQRALRDQQRPEADTDPFKPPAPASRAVSSFSDPFGLSSRPATKVSRADSYAYGSIYDGYATSRRGTTHGDPEIEGMPTSMPTPATSSLLPWSTPSQTKPPVPPVPAHTRATSRNQRNDRLPLDPQGQAGRTAGSSKMQMGDVRRPPPAAVMAQTPLMQGGWQGVIPPFR